MPGVSFVTAKAADGFPSLPSRVMALSQRRMRASKKQKKQQAQPALVPLVWRGQWFGAAGLCLLALLVYIPTYKAGFICDDDVLAGNALLNQGWHGLRDIWFSAKFGDYVPMTATTF